jgi:hypothetical protein
LLRADTRPLVADQVGDNEIFKSITAVRAAGKHDGGIEEFTRAMNVQKDLRPAYRGCDLVVYDIATGQADQVPSSIVRDYERNNSLERNRELFTYMLKRGQQRLSVGMLDMRGSDGRLGSQSVVYWFCPGQGTSDNTVGGACMRRDS